MLCLWVCLHSSYAPIIHFINSTTQSSLPPTVKSAASEGATSSEKGENIREMREMKTMAKAVKAVLRKNGMRAQRSTREKKRMGTSSSMKTMLSFLTQLITIPRHLKLLLYPLSLVPWRNQQSPLCQQCHWTCQWMLMHLKVMIATRSWILEILVLERVSYGLFIW